MNWNQKTIHEWGVRTFGEPARHPLGVAIRMTKEAVELSEILSYSDDEDKIGAEAADVLIVLYQVANCVGCDLEDIMDIQPIADMVSEMDKEIETEMQIAAVINKASLDLISALFHQAPMNEVMTQMARIRAALNFLEDLYPFHLLNNVQDKMAINAARQWSKAADGSFQHI